MSMNKLPIIIVNYGGSVTVWPPFCPPTASVSRSKLTLKAHHSLDSTLKTDWQNI